MQDEWATRAAKFYRDSVPDLFSLASVYFYTFLELYLGLVR